MAQGKNGLPAFAIWTCILQHKILRFLCGLVDKIAGFHPGGQGSIPLEDFYTFWQYLENFQILKSCHSHIGTFRNTGPFSLKSGGSILSLNTVRIHGVSRRLFKKIDWKLTFYEVKLVEVFVKLWWSTEIVNIRNGSEPESQLRQWPVCLNPQMCESRLEYPCVCRLFQM